MAERDNASLFFPVRGYDNIIQNREITDGYVYYAIDTGKIYVDAKEARHTMGAAGAAIYYGQAEGIPEDNITGHFQFPKTGLTNTSDSPKIDDIILNTTDGTFYRVLAVMQDYFDCSKLAVSGAGGGGGSVVEIRPSLTVEALPYSTIINGQEQEVWFTATSAKDDIGNPLDKILTISWNLSTTVAGVTEVYETGTFNVNSGERTSFEFGTKLRESATSKLSLTASSTNHVKPSYTREVPVTTSALTVQLPTSFSNTTTYKAGDAIQLTVNVVGNLKKIVDFEFDGKLIETKYLGPGNDPATITLNPELKTHGSHSVKITLYQDVSTNNKDHIKGLHLDPIKYEMAIIEANNQTPIIWLGDYQSQYYNYDSIQIPFLVYNPKDTKKATVELYKNGIELESSPREITKFDDFNYWEIADADMGQINRYQISCSVDGLKAEREIMFTVVKDPNRNMEIVKQEYLQLNFDPTGRSNNESVTNRGKWANKEGVLATFENFNWYNNGWIMDEKTRATCLRISNGAKFEIPFKELIYGSNSDSEQSNTVEMRFRIRNIQNYSNLITNITRYKIKEGTSYRSDEKEFTEFLAQNIYTNYDAYLQATLDPDIYESLEFANVQKRINLNNVACGFSSGSDNNIVGICVGPQDTFFSNGTNTVNVSFVKDDMISVAFVYEHSLKLLYIYINGVITGVIASSLTDPEFKIATDKIIFNSNYCDIDLFKLRVYNTALNVNDIVTNYSVDTKDVGIYDQRNLAVENNDLKEYQLNYANVLAWNEAHPDDYLMPYIIYDTTDFADEKLPWSKAIKRNIKVTFVNTPLERAYAKGELNKLAEADGLIVDKNDPKSVAAGVKLYYKHHCPSWTSTLLPEDRVEIAVQGTSSEFYPRRNYKIKTKKKDFPNTWGEIEDEAGNKIPGYEEEDALNIFMNRGPYAEDFIQDQKDIVEDYQNTVGKERTRMVDGWYMNNYTNGTDRWTMKVDYMESSGSYNAGFASLVGNAYTKHPLQDYMNVMDGADTNLRSDIKAIGDKGIRWNDFRTSLLGFPVMAFHAHGDKENPEYTFIGFYRMLLDKGSDEVLGFKTSKKITSKLVGKYKTDDDGQEYWAGKKMRDLAECWEYSTNNRTFCSFKDPWNRVELSFKAPEDASNAWTADGAPVVMNNFEYRYSEYEDYLDMAMEYSKLSQEKIDELNKEFEAGLTLYADGNEDGRRAMENLVVDTFYKNWEDVCKWVYSTNTDNVPSQGTYEKVDVGKQMYEKNKFYILTTDEENNSIYKITDEDFNIDTTYFEKDTEATEQPAYKNAYVVNDEAFLYKKNAFYQEVAGTYSLVSDETFSDTIQYYILKQDNYADRCDLLIAPAESFEEGVNYYSYNSQAKINAEGQSGAVIPEPALTAETFASGKYYVAKPVVYNDITYTHDTKEYRAAKFKNEVTQHFDPEYLATYFVMTEVFELYDSRGKNCMMATWGPHKEGGNYIWYPIFYDIDTQLGINNTGIPSFEFNVDATEQNNFSTSDSILWNNFYKFFKSSYILTKYQNIRGIDTTAWEKLANPPMQSVDYLEKWYTFNPEVTNNIACRGLRPMIATNLDMFFKYITIYNLKATEQGVGYLDGEGKMIDGSDGSIGTYFYALQGDRSQSRQQFLTNRIEYTDSWLNQGNYARGGANRIRGRISANNMDGSVHSDNYVEPKDGNYWKGTEFGPEWKTHEFDAQYWLDLKPIRSSYVTAGDDSANYPSQKYDGITPLKFVLKELETGIRQGENYPEQLLYIYGTNQMSDMGDFSKLYWTEFYLEGDASNLTRLKLGHDGLDENNKGWYNKKLNGMTLPKSLPLLKEANFSNITFSTETTLDLMQSEKLENFRATGSNIVGVDFADGVALNTLYLPKSVKSLNLRQANLLKELIIDSKETIPETVDRKTGELKANPGLYLEGFFEDSTTSSDLNTISIEGGGLGFNSYTLLKQYHKKKKGGNTSPSLTMTNVNWYPYVKLSEGDEFDSNATYYMDNGHYGFVEYDKSNYSEKSFNALVISGEMYRDDRAEGEPLTTLGAEAIDILYEIKNINKNDFSNGAYGFGKTNITGTILIDNADSIIKESEVRNQLQVLYPNISFFFTNVEKAYSAKFVIYDEVTGATSYVDFIQESPGTPSVQKISQEDFSKGTKFTNPFDLYKPKKTHYDFIGWSKNFSDKEGSSTILTEKDKDKWNDFSIITEDNFDYTYYAIFKITSYDIEFYDGQGNKLITKKVVYGTSAADAANFIPYQDESKLSLYQAYNFLGWSLSQDGEAVDMNTYIVSGKEEFYALFDLVEDIRKVEPHYEWFNFTKLDTTIIDNSQLSRPVGYRISPKTGITLTGKIVIPREYNGFPIVSIDGFSNSQVTHILIETNDKVEPIYEIYNGAFRELKTLKFFEFESTNVNTIQNNAFLYSNNLDANIFRMYQAPVQYIGTNAFQDSFAEATGVTIIIPASVYHMGNKSFAYNKFIKADLVIGDQNNHSELNFATSYSGNNIGIFYQNNALTDYRYQTVNFYSKYYDLWTDTETASGRTYPISGAFIDSSYSADYGEIPSSWSIV